MATEADTADTPETRYTHYHNIFSFPVTLSPDTGRITVQTSSRLGAVVMPGDLGERLREHLTRVTGGCGPILRDPENNRWTVLVRPDLDRSIAKLYRSLRGCGVGELCAGLEIDLPTPVDTGVERREWVVPPAVDVPLPSLRVVLVAITACVLRVEAHV
ncbi:hypothetical protein [Nocardia panacis]|uniref:hypothetical protein n=1 Tax=Nocardia panacis TaxID=2340916 RepID=UPI000E761A42|nr:hypothetical protein [Nocardia panacis]